MNAEWLINWWNLIFLLPFALALFYLALYTVSGITFGDSDLDAQADLDTDADLDADGDLDHDLDADHDLDHDADADSDHGANESPALAVLSWLGVGKVPLSIMLLVLLLTWGAVGFVANAALATRGATAAWVSIPLAATSSLFITRTVVMLIARYLPLYETTARRRHALLGSTGEAIFAINDKFGMAAVRDDTGELFQVGCRVEHDEAIPKGSTIKLVSYNAKQGLFGVIREESNAAVKTV
jgi:membrane protein implicated in regulation of membrane protease activity